MIDNDTQAVWSRLSEKEKKEFERLAAGGKLSTLVEVWTPWWKEKVLSILPIHLIFIC